MLTAILSNRPAVGSVLRELRSGCVGNGFLMFDESVHILKSCLLIFFVYTLAINCFRFFVAFYTHTQKTSFDKSVFLCAAFLVLTKPDQIRFDHFLVPVQCTGFGLLSPEKASSHSAAIPSFSPCVQCFRVSGCQAYSFTTDRYGIFNVSTPLGACRTHEWRGGGWGGGRVHNKFAPELTRRDRKTVSHPAPPGD